jgi:hypothetical protein
VGLPADCNSVSAVTACSFECSVYGGNKYNPELIYNSHTPPTRENTYTSNMTEIYRQM